MVAIPWVKSRLGTVLFGGVPLDAIPWVQSRMGAILVLPFHFNMIVKF